MAKQINKNPLIEDEIAVLRLLQEGLTYLEIADKLIVSPRTIEKRGWNAQAKLKANNITHAVSLAIDGGIIANFMTPAAMAIVIIPLSARQLEVLYLISKGYSMKMIGIHLVISPQTVAVHKREMKIKLSGITLANTVAKGKYRGII